MPGQGVLAVNTVRSHCSQILFRNEHVVNTPSEHVFADPKMGRRLSFLAYEEVFPRRVHSVFISEHNLRTVNVNSVLDHVNSVHGQPCVLCLFRLHPLEGRPETERFKP